MIFKKQNTPLMKKIQDLQTPHKVTSDFFFVKMLFFIFVLKMKKKLKQCFSYDFGNLNVDFTVNPLVQ